MGIFNERGFLSQELRRVAEQRFDENSPEAAGEPVWKKQEVAPVVKNPLDDLSAAIAAVQGVNIPRDLSNADKVSTISAEILEEKAERERLAAERVVVIDCEGIDGSTLLVKDGEKGPLLKALDADKEVILNGFHKMKAGTDVSFIHFALFINGISDEYNVFAPDSYGVDPPIATYTRKDIKSNFNIAITKSNHMEDGIVTRSHKKSVKSERIKIVPHP